MNYKEVINYLIFGVLTTTVNLLSYFIFTNTFLAGKTSINIQMANILSWIIAALFAYVTNRKYVFKSKTHGEDLKKEVINFFSARVFTLIIDVVVMFIMFSVMHIDDIICKFAGQVVVITFNYFLSKLVIFKH